MMAKVSAEYYNLEKVAEVLSVSTVEVNRLREQSKLRGFRDGANWKFQKEDVHTYLAETIKARSGNAGNGRKSGDSDFDILDSQGSPSSFDLLVENADSLPDDNQLVSVHPQAHPASDLDLAALDNNDDDLSLAEETRISAVPVMPIPKKSQGQKSAVLQEEDSDAVLSLSSDSQSDAVLLDDNESILGGSGSSPQLGLAGDSGFDVLVAGDDDSDLFEVDIEEEKTSPVFADKEDFVLEPAKTMDDGDESDSSSQVIAIDAGFAGMDSETSPFGNDFNPSDDFSGFGTGSQPASVETAANDPFGGASFPDTSVMPVSVQPKKVPAAEEEYSTGLLIALISTMVVMLLPGMMLIDTMAHMWSWDNSFVLNSALMNLISGWFGL